MGTTNSGSTLPAVSYDYKAATLRQILIFVGDSPSYFYVLFQGKWKIKQINDDKQSKQNTNNLTSYTK